MYRSLWNWDLSCSILPNSSIFNAPNCIGSWIVPSVVLGIRQFTRYLGFLTGPNCSQSTFYSLLPLFHSLSDSSFLSVSSTPSLLLTHYNSLSTLVSLSFRTCPNCLDSCCILRQLVSKAPSTSLCFYFAFSFFFIYSIPSYSQKFYNPLFHLSVFILFFCCP